MNNFEFGEVMKARTETYALEIIKLYRNLPRTEENMVLGRQVLRAGTSVAANYRTVYRARSQADFVSKLNIVVEEVDETILWFELLEEARVCPNDQVATLKREGNELLQILASALATARRK